MMYTNPWFYLGVFFAGLAVLCWAIIGLKTWGKSSLKELTTFETRLGVISVILALLGVFLILIGVAVS